MPSKQRIKKKKRRRIALAVILCLAIIALLIFGWRSGRGWKNKRTLGRAETLAGDEGLLVSIIDVGQGSSALITINGESMLIDTGPRDAKDEVEGLLTENGIYELKYMLLSHPHADHIGCAAALCYDLPVSEIIMSTAVNEIAAYKALMEAVTLKDIAVDYPEHGEVYELGGGRITILTLDEDHGEELNDWSLVVRVDYDGKSFLFMGDAGKNVEARLLEELSRDMLEADVLIAGHHGSSDAGSREFIQTVKPAEAVISCGRDNDYGHPHRETLETFDELDITVRRTDLMGSICYAAKEGGELWVYEIQ